MVQESIVEYINSQMKLGVSRDTIKSTLTGAGWVPADVEDTLRKVESAKAAQAMPAAAASAGKPAMSAGGAATSSAPQTIKVSDLVSAPSSSSMPSSMSTKSAGPKSPLTGPSAVSTASAMPAGKKAADTIQDPSAMGVGMKPRGSRGALITEIVLVIIIIAVGGFAGFLFMQNNSLNGQLASLNGQSSGVNSQLSALQAQLTASTTALTAQVSTLTATNQELQTELSFLAVPSGTAPGATSTATISGTVAAGKTAYVITATYGAKISVANSKEASVIAALTPLVPAAPVVATSTNATSTATSSAAAATSSAPATPAAPTVAQFAGTYVPGSDSITLTSVNGTSL